MRICQARLFPCLVILCLVYGALSNTATRGAEPRAENTIRPARLWTIDFVENRGQWPESARFVARNGNVTAAFERAAIRLRRDGPDAAAVDLIFEGASEQARVEGETRRGGYYNFFFGSDPSRWRSNVAAFASVRYRGLYDGIDAHVRDQAGVLEYDLLLAAGADLPRVSIRADGATALEMARDGALLIHTPGGILRQSPPRTWEQAPDGSKRSIESRFRLIDDRRYGFEAPARDPDLPLVIDPGLEWATFLGGAAHEYATDLAMTRDGSGDVIVTGFTQSADFPATTGQIGPLGQAPFIARISATGQLVYATLFGGSAVDGILGMAVDASSGPVVVGTTNSVDFPTTAGAWDRTRDGEYDAFVTKFDPSGSQIVFSTFIGGAALDEAWTVAIGPGGSVIVAGNTGSQNFPTTAGAYDRTANTYVPAGSLWDAFVARFDATGSALTYSTYLGGQEIDYATDVVVDQNDFVTLAGHTWDSFQSGLPFPTTADAFDRTLNGNPDVFVARLKLDGAGQADLRYSTFLGGSDTENATGLALDPNNPELVTVAGWTYSGNFPVTPGALLTTHFSPINATMGFVARFLFPAAGGGSRQWATYYGSPGNQQIDDVTVDGTGAAVVVGASGTLNPPTTERSYDRTPAQSDAFVARIDSAGRQILYGTLLGGSSFEGVMHVAPADDNTVVVAGRTKSPDFPVTPGASDTVYAADGSASPFNVYDAFVAKLTLEPTETGDVTATPPSLLAPAAGATFVSPAFVDFDWTDAADPSGVEAYHIQVSPNATFTDDILAELNDWYETWPADSLAAIDFRNGTYHWRVRTLDRVHNLSEWSAVRTFTVGTPPTPAAPTLISPANDATVTQPVTLDWNDVNGAVSYRVQVDDSSTFAAPFVRDQTVTVSQAALSSLTSRRHWWRVRGINSAGTAGAWSPVRRFTPQTTAVPASLSAISLSPSTVIGGNATTGTARLTSAAPSGGAVVTLTSSNTAVAALPATLTIPAGASSGTFAVTSKTVAASTAVTISGAYGGSSRSAILTVSPPPAPASLSAVSVTPTSVGGGSPSQGRVTLTSAAPAGGTAVALTSSHTSASLPGSVTVAAGSTTVTFTVATTSVTTSTAVTISAISAGVTRTATLTVTPPAANVTLTVTATGRSGERVTSSPAGVNVSVGSSGTATFAAGTPVTLSVTNGRDAIWSGACSSGGNKTRTCALTLSANASVTANVQ